MNKEIRIDVSKQTEEELALANEHAQLIFKFNNTMPGTAEYAELLHRIFPAMGENSRVSTPLTAVRPHMVSIGKNVVIMPGFNALQTHFPLLLGVLAGVIFVVSWEFL